MKLGLSPVRRSKARTTRHALAIRLTNAGDGGACRSFSARHELPDWAKPADFAARKSIRSNLISAERRAFAWHDACDPFVGQMAQMERAPCH